MRDSKHLHYELATVVDLHTHLALKATLLKRLVSKHPLWRTQRGFYPLSVRTNFNLLQDGGVDILFSTVYPPEKPLLDDIALFNLFGLKFSKLGHLRYILGLSSAWRRLFKGSYFDITVRGLCSVSKLVGQKEGVK